MASMEIVDPYLTTALKLLHSSAQDSAEKLRIMLDNEITKSHDKSKLVTSLLTKKQLNDEKNAPGSGFKKQKPKKVEEVKVIRPQSPQEPIPILDDSSDEGEGAMDDLLDLTCVICRQVDNTANNQLYECVDCQNLYHQLCHDPKIISDSNWICSSCKGKSKSSKSARFDSPSSSSSSSSAKKLTINVVSPSEKKKSSHSPSKKKSSEKSSSSSSSSRSRSSKK